MPEEKLEVMYLPVALRGRLQETAAAADDIFAGFSFKNFGEDACKYDNLAKRVGGLLPQVDAWLSTGVKGPNVHTFGQA